MRRAMEKPGVWFGVEPSSGEPGLAGIVRRCVLRLLSRLLSITSHACEWLDVVQCGQSSPLLSGAIAAADPGSRAWHWGACDPAGFAAMGVAETLLHTYDIAQGLGVSWLLPAERCAAVLRRLFPDAPPGDPARVLLWSTGRADLDGRPRLTSWVWKAAR